MADCRKQVTPYSGSRIAIEFSLPERALWHSPLASGWEAAGTGAEERRQRRRLLTYDRAIISIEPIRASQLQYRCIRLLQAYKSSGLSISGLISRASFRDHSDSIKLHLKFPSERGFPRYYPCNMSLHRQVPYSVLLYSRRIASIRVKMFIRRRPGCTCDGCPAKP